MVIIADPITTATGLQRSPIQTLSNGVTGFRTLSFSR
jgi:hypothetical protein